MPSVSLSINGGPATDLSNVQDLAQAALQDGSTALPFLLSGQLADDLTQPLSSLGKGKSVALTLSAGNPSWTLPGSVATFTLGASASANFTILQAGDTIFSFDVDYQGGNTQTMTVPAGMSYIDIKLNFAINGTLSASSNIGAIGVSGNAGASATYIVENFKAFASSMPIIDAVKHAIATFTLPLHPKTVDGLSDGDCLHYDFDGSLNVGFGVTYGVSGQVSASSISAISGLFNPNQKFFQVSAPTVSYGASVGASAAFNWSRTFECFLQRQGAAGAAVNTATLHISAGKDTQRSVTLQANAGITQTTPPQLSVTPQDVLGLVLNKITGSSSIDPNDWKLQAVNGAAQQAITQATAEVQKYIDDANNWLSGLFQDLQNRGSISLAAVFASSDHFVSAFTYTFDLSNAAFPGAWQSAISGDFLAVLRSGATTLDAGSGLEKLHTTSTKLTLTWFGLNYGSVASQWNQTNITYQGKGLFALEAKAGADLTTTSNKAGTATSVYFVADADGTDDGHGNFVATKPTVALCGRLACTSSPAQTSRLGALLHALQPGSAADAAGDALKAISLQSAPGLVVVDITIGLSALARVTSDRYVNGKQPPPPHAQDTRNWNAFTQAETVLQQKSDPAGYLSREYQVQAPGWYMSYHQWESFNEAVNQSNTTDRRSGLDVFAQATAFWNQLASSDPDSLTKTELATYFVLGQQFMNLCEAIDAVLDLVANATLDWPALVTGIKNAGADIDPWYGPATILAIASLTTDSQSLTVQTVLAAHQSAAVTVTIN
jgi:hypothetical protein